ncbi:MAG TPA: GH92 family glycosyl hydrolase, partial [Bacteroidota bacterium]
RQCRPCHLLSKMKYSHFLILSLIPSFYMTELLAQDLSSFVNPFIGTANGGNTFPGAVRPWGMVSVSPHTAPGSPSGYIHGSKFFYGFGHNHLSGTGCADLGSVILTAVRGTAKSNPESYRTSFSEEDADPGYYRVMLVDADCLAEATVTTRCGITRFTAQRGGVLTLQVDAGRNLSRIGGGSVRVVAPDEAEGFNEGGGFCGELNRYRAYFVLRLNRNAVANGTWKADRVNNESTVLAGDTSIGAWFQFNLLAGERLEARVGISYVSIANARLNLNAETDGNTFETIRRDARTAWNRELGRIDVQGSSRDDFTKFYTALYHSLIHPNIISDVNGEYPRSAKHGTGTIKARDHYSVFSLWDTYRTLHPLLTLVYPERQSAIIQSMLDIYDDTGWLPKWELIGSETYMMVGDPAGPVIADSYLKGITDFDIEKGYVAVCKPSLLTTDTSAPPIRAGYHDFLRYGYIPADQDTTADWWVWGPVSTALEYCLDDWAISQMAAKLGRRAEAQGFEHKSQYYRTLFDSNSQLLRPKLRNGQWLTPFDSKATEGSGSWQGSGGPGYVEGNAWNYSWFAPHDIRGLISLFGGNKQCALRLQECFDNGQFTINNEPDIGYPYIFTEIGGYEAHTAPLIQALLKNKFGTGPDGLPGNDDAGTISAWYIFSALGFYPSCPASGIYQMGIPLFRRAAIALNKKYYSASEFTVELQGDPADDATINSIWLNDTTRLNYQISHRDLVNGARVVFQLGRN